MENEIVEFINQNKIVAIARGVSAKDIVKTAQALYAGGIKLIEITFDQASEDGVWNTENSIRLVKEAMKDKMCIGAGTVMTEEQAEAAARAGADFVLAPNVNTRVIKRIKELKMTAVPGALTPSEIAEAYQAGADIVKLFPAGNFGLDYLKAIQGPMNHIPLMAVGGVDLTNAKAFLEGGFTSVGIGSNIVKNSLIEDGKFEEIRKLAEKFIEMLRQEEEYA